MLKHFKSQSLRKQISAAGILGIVITVILSIISIFSYKSLKNTQEQEAKQYLNEVVSQYRNAIDIKIDGNLQTLRALSTFIEKSGDIGLVQILEQLRAESRQNDFLRMGYIMSDGTGYFIDTDGTEHYDIDVGDESFIQRALTGEDTVSDTLTDIFSGETVNCYSVPVYLDGAVTGALTATTSSTAFSSIIEQKLFGGNAYTHIIRSNGDYVVRSSHAVIQKDIKNIFDDGKVSPEDRAYIEKSAKSGQSSFSTFEYKNEKYWTTIFPIGINDWNLFCVVPQDYLSENFGTLMTVFIVIMLCITALFSVLFLYIYHIIKRSRQEITKLAYTDVLTGSDNRNKFILEMQRLLSDNRNYAMVLLNINGFKFVNEFYGYEAGNMLLKHIATVLADNIGEQELCYRDNADQFGMLLRCRRKKELAERLRSIQEQIHKFRLSRNQDYHILCNFGVMIIDEGSKSAVNTDFDTVMNGALLALESVKGNEMDSIAFYDRHLHEKAARKTEIENRMWNAVENHEFIMYLQPKFSLKTGLLHSAEALVRWQPGDGKMIYPDEFIPIFEQNGFITKLDMYMLEEACRCLADWDKRGFPAVPIAVNQSRIFFYDTEYLNKLEEIVRFYAVNPSLIILEVTETVAMNNLEQIKTVIARLHSMGFKVSMDDFGSGYSSLNTLRELHVDEIKLDREFLSFQTESGRDEAIIRNVIHLANDLSASTVAEGIETEQQLEFLKSLSCDIGQGYYFCRPVPAADFFRAVAKLK
ncbi:sensor domain-containing phosphodiesterase [Lachnospiraceae bacterium]|uniref:bifunctional diguanylate cyclase/phosphodiesterase n=1 Tax=Extibacter sp. GGCC_0201 TaxID=2731209 RepID=UPI001AA1843F|nr:EAL domain-containing protein [Extibacter sp. GGCC_0201]MBO1719306.1 EAL domain-containing protein [Extibacter sp. GGCC_0201]BDF34033.1 sensor domain-containing phosphodiesterase [Lachnospiraceae bacterium]BDF38037.1 sensor domain-containing phosphodiesterase [Lachnospiraceae bacterium]